MQLQDLIKIRLQPLINTVKLGLDRWDKLLLSLSLWGKDTIMKMNILPCLISVCKPRANRNPQAKLLCNKSLVSKILWDCNSTTKDLLLKKKSSQRRED